jgi:hypothetical protein
MKKLAFVLSTFVLLSAIPGWGGLNPDEYEKISQCVLVRERAALAGQKVQITGKFLQGSEFCHVIRKAGIDTRDYFCFALGKPCIVRMYLHKKHPQIPLLLALEGGDKMTAYGIFDYMGLDYNYMILDGVSVKAEQGTQPQ